MPLTPFLNTISRLSKDLNIIIQKEDVFQELSKKVLLILPYLENIKKEEAQRIVAVALKNHLLDLVRFYGRRPDTSIYATEASIIKEDYQSLTLETILTAQFTDFEFLITRQLSAEDILQCQDLAREIMEWTKNQDEETRLFITYAISPSDEIENTWENMKKEYPRYNHYTYIPPFTLGKIIGVSSNKINRILIELKSYLSKTYFGY